MFQNLHHTWASVLAHELQMPYIRALEEYIVSQYSNGPVFPPHDQIFTAFNVCPFDHVRVVILGQDPYHNPGEAHGLCFSVRDSVRIPPSLQNIFKEIGHDLNTPPPLHRDLTRIATQGVFLLNSVLTVAENAPGSHRDVGWERFTDAVIRAISQNHTHIVFLLWGAYAQSKRIYIDPTKHCILEAPHPSPLSAYRGFFGCKHFSKTNTYLTQHGKEPIVW